MQKRLAQQILEKIHSNIPSASLAVTGSVARNTYSKNSDIDLIFSDCHIKDSYLIHFLYEKIEITISIIPINIYERKYSYFLANYFSSLPSIIHYSEIKHDPQNILLQLKEKTNEIINKRFILKLFLINNLKDDIMQSLSIKPTSFINEKNIICEVINKILVIFSLKYYSKEIGTKSYMLDIFSIIKKTDINLYNIIERVLPLHRDSLNITKISFYDYISLAY